eukprot:scaffold652019_cov48-Prasinocladus_malaysianus.AAC.1
MSDPTGSTGECILSLPGSHTAWRLCTGCCEMRRVRAIYSNPLTHSPWQRCHRAWRSSCRA